MDLTATMTVEITAISLRTVNTIYLKIRQRLAEACEPAAPLNGAFEMDESDFGAHRVRGRIGHSV